MNIIDLIRKGYKKHGKKAVLIFLIYFVTKWTLTILFGAQIISYFKGFLG